MSDLITEGVIRKTGSAPFPDTSAPPAPAESDAPDVVHSQIDAPIEGSSDEERVRNSVRELNRQRERDGELDDLHKRPIVRVHYDSDHGDKTLREVTRDVSDYHRARRPDVQSAIYDYGGDPAEVLSRAQDPDFVQQLRPDWSFAECQAFARTGIEPPTKVGVVRYDGKLVRPLHDDQPVTINDAFGSRHELKQGVKNFRAAQAEMSRQALADAEAAALDLQAQQRGTTNPAEAPQQPVQQAQPAPQQPRPDPLAAERQRLTWEAQAHAALRQSSVEEMQAMVAAEQIVAAFPELKSEAAIRDAYARNPQRFQQIQQAAQTLQNCQAQFQRANETRSVREAQLQQAENEHINRVYRQYSKANDDAFAARTPEMKDTAKAHALRAATRQMMLDVGFTEDEINTAWAGRVGVPLRDYRVQTLLADGARWRMAQAKARNITKASVPPVQRPGVARPRGADSEADMARLEQAVGSAVGERAALRAAAKLTQARRRAGML